jgi:hypothetical protein
LGKERRLTELHKKIKHLTHTMLHWAEDNKTKEWTPGVHKGGHYVIPQRNGVDWKSDFKFVTKIDMMLADGLDDKLKKNEMKMCNELYKFYSQTYIKDILRKK